MSPLVYLTFGVLAGGFVAAIIYLLIPRRTSGVESELVKRLEMLNRAQERGERIIREEMSRGREESANASKAQREELSKSLEGVRSIVDLRLKQLQDDGNVQEDWLVMRLELNGDKFVIRQLKAEYMKEKNITSAEQLRKILEQNLEDSAMYEKDEVVTATRLAAN